VTESQRCRLPSLLIRVERVEWIPDPGCSQIVTCILWELVSDGRMEGRGKFQLFNG
jgi:hypothetical protein